MQSGSTALKYLQIMNKLFKNKNNNNNNELYLHGHKRRLQYCKSILTITITKSNSYNNIKLWIINFLMFLIRIFGVVLTAC